MQQGKRSNWDLQTQDYPELPEWLVMKVAQHRAAGLRGVITVDPIKLARDRLSLRRAHEHFERIRPFLPTAHARMLEVGSGFGSFLAYAARWGGVDAYGIEPDSGASAICGELLQELGERHDRVTRAVGESLPFDSDSMDLVCSFNVFEHVAVPEQVLAESIRVLKPGGHLYFSFPSYGSWWEGHYGVLWFPSMPKWLAKLYVGLLGRNPSFIDGLQFITYKRLMRMLEPLRSTADILDLGEKVWEERLRLVQFSDWAQLGRLKHWIQFLHRLHLIDLMVRVGHRLHWETPFILIARKR